ncbi:MAG: hypothetical protein AAFU50_00730 [Pseudomonadota bacterium]
MSRPTRRALLTTGVAAGLSMPALARSADAQTAKAGDAPTTVSWTLHRPFARSRDAISDALADMATSVATLTNGAFKITIAEADEAEQPQLLADVGAGKADAVLVEPARAFGENTVGHLLGGVPFGLNARLHRAWLIDRRGLQLINAALGADGLLALPCGALGAHMGGWFRQEVTSAAGFKDRKIAIDGLGAAVLQRLGAKPVTLGPDAARRALQTGEIDGVVWGTPYDDESLRLYQNASVLHYPGWWNGAGQLALMVGAKKHAALADPFKLALSLATAEADRAILARYDAQNPSAVRRAVASGVDLQPYNEAMLDTAFTAAEAEMTARAEASPQVKELLASLRRMRRDGYLGQQLSETTFDTYMMIQQRKQTL